MAHNHFIPCYYLLRSALIHSIFFSFLPRSLSSGDGACSHPLVFFSPSSCSPFPILFPSPFFFLWRWRRLSSTHFFSPSSCSPFPFSFLWRWRTKRRRGATRRRAAAGEERRAGEVLRWQGGGEAPAREATPGFDFFLQFFYKIFSTRFLLWFSMQFFSSKFFTFKIFTLDFSFSYFIIFSFKIFLVKKLSISLSVFSEKKFN